jgi:hypothetical protein
MSDRDNPLSVLGMVNEAALGSQLWKVHQEWQFENTPETSDEVLLNEAELGRKINCLLLPGWIRCLAARA